MITTAKKQELITEHKRTEADTGSVEVQVSILSTRISEITEHLKLNKKDFAARRGLLMLVGKRKRLLAYLKKSDVNRYKALIEKLGLRK